MRAVLIALAACLGLAACSGKDSDAGKNGGAQNNKADDITREQARFDAERKPEKVVQALKIGPGSRVADVGAGSGLLTVHLARAVKPTGQVVATDIDSAVLDLMHSRLQAAGLADIVERRVVGADTPGLEDATYDAILLAEVDHYFGDPIGWLKAAAKALKPTGRIVISNRIHHRAKSMAAAQKAGLVLEAESTPVPTHFIASFLPPGAAK
ncbi:MAG: methyltransferase domain-containing protein [Deltaproteobacteria bacterium]|nr:methyltransferase domain-containing protein [Deltaproteobacteria bacterium]MDQ3296102.1 methyltransferase domain-containing protein [Myxococcota bacterium]